MIVYTVNIPIKNEIPIDRLQTIIERHLCAGYDKIELGNMLGYRTVESEWDTDYIFSFADDKKALTITLNAPCDRMTGDIIKHIPKLIAALYNEKPFPVEAGYITSLGEPININTSEIFQNKCIEMFCGRGQGILPMVYISRLPYNYDNKKFNVDSDRLAKICIGLACVVTEDSLKTSYELREAAEGRKVYNGYVGIYYPHIKSYDFLIQKDGESELEFEHRIFETIRQWWLNSRQSEYAWGRLKVIKEKQAASEERFETERLIQAFESDLSDAKNDNERLRIELQAEKDKRSAAELEAERLRYAVQNKSKGCLLDAPDFDEWYTGEFSDIILNILKERFTQRTESENRLVEVLSDLIEKNPIIGIGEELFLDMASAIREADSTEKILSALVRYGWTVVSKSPHIKLHFKNNPRYSATLAVSPSDTRQKDNFISDIMKKINPKKG